MTSKAALMTVENAQQQTLADLRRPNEHVQFGHIFLTLCPDRPLDQLCLDDILDTNWQGVETAVRDAIVRVCHEGDLSSGTLQDTIRLVALALRKLESEDARLRRFVAEHPRVGLIAYLTALFPGPVGESVRKVIAARRNAAAKIVEFACVRDRLFEARIKLAEEVDESLDALLTNESAEYRELRESVPQLGAVAKTAAGILGEIKEWEELEVSIADQEDRRIGDADAKDTKRLQQLGGKQDAYCEFATAHCGQEINDLGTVEIALRQLVAEIKRKTEPVELRLQAMRDARKRELYGQAAAMFDATTNG